MKEEGENIQIQSKKCNKCNKVKELQEFNFIKYKQFFRRSCKKCESNFRRQYRLNNIEKLRNKEKENWYKRKDKKHEYYLKNKEKLSKYYKNRRDKINQRMRMYTANKKQTDIGFKLKITLSSRILTAIRKNFGRKAFRTIQLLGCDIAQVKIHLESKFQPGMTWENHGSGEEKWQIDHIIPCASFDLTDAEQQKKCFHYTNLQPLWDKDNRIKSDKLPNGELGRDLRKNINVV